MPDRRRSRAVVAGYAALALAWAGFARVVARPLIASAYQGRSVEPLNRFFRGRTPHPLAHYLWIWDAFAGAVLIALGLHLALVLVAGRGGRLLVGFGAAFLGVTLLSGPRHDYVADLEIWSVVRSGADPWWIPAGRGFLLNAYGPLFNLFAPVAWLNPMAPKLLFAASYVGFVAWLARGRPPSRWEVLAAIANPLPWVEVAYFGHWDVLVGLACIAAIALARGGRDATSGLAVAAGVLLKVVPAVVLPFVATGNGRFRPRIVAAALVAIAAGFGLSWLAWGEGTFRPFGFGASRGSNLLSIFRFLRGRYSPLGPGADLDRLALPCLAAAGLATFGLCLRRRVGAAAGASLAIGVTLLFYQAGFVQYQVIYGMVLMSWAHADRPFARDRFAAGAILAYFGWLAGFDVYYAAIGGVIHPGDPGDWVEEVVGLPTFALGALLLVALTRAAGRAPSSRRVRVVSC